MKGIIIFILLFLVSDIFAQLQMRIKELNICDVIADSNSIDNLFYEDGPYLDVVCIIKNNTDTIQKLQLKKHGMMNQMQILYIVIIIITKIITFFM